MDAPSAVRGQRSNGLDDTPLRRDPWAFATQLALIGIFILLFIGFLQLARFVFLPVVAAAVIGILMGPISDRAAARGVPQPLSALLLVLLLVGILSLLILVLAAPVSDWVGKAPEIGARLKDKLWLLDYPIQAMRDLRDVLNPGGDHSAPLDFGISNLIQPALGLLTPAIGFVTPAIGQLLIFLGTLFFFVSARVQLRRGIVLLLPNGDARLRGLRVIHDAEANLTAYFATVSVIYFAEGVLVALASSIIGLPNAVAWGALTFVLSFIPYLGPGAVIVILFSVGVIHFPSITHALIAPIVYIVMATVEGNFITPAVVGRRLTLTPLAVFLSLVFWAWLWGPIGAFLATPLLTIGLVVAGQLFPSDKPVLPE